MSETYKKLSRPPADALKKIIGGRLQGMSDIKPQWRYEVMDEVFGPVGTGWKYEIVRQWTEPAPYEQVFCFTNVLVYVKTETGWSDPIPGTGGSMLIERESNKYAKDDEPKFKYHANDEGFKMSLTDALSVALGKLGVGADIYRGRWDGSKYRDEPPAPPPPPPLPQPPKLSAQDEADMNRCLAARKILGYTMDQLKEEKARLKTYAAVADYLEELVDEQASVEAAADEGFGTKAEQVAQLFVGEVQ
jgi:hypothetical protein